MNLTPSPFAPDRFPQLPVVSGVRASTGSRGFYARSGQSRDDVFLFAFDDGTSCAGVFTQSGTASADVDWCRQALAAGGGTARALVANSGNSNAFTGTFGAQKNAATVTAMTKSLGVPEHACFLAATGVIGEPLPDPNYVGEIIPALADTLAAPDWEACARAFMTTDTFPKGAGQSIDLAGVPVAFAGIAKGSGMIAPNMATMLAYIFTDAAITPALLDALIRDITGRTFNSVTVDGDTSTSDTFMVFATGKSGMTPITSDDDPRLAVFAEALETVAMRLALQLVEDGEGASKIITIGVTGASTDASAKRVACAVANSPLVKTALAASDANWGRIVMAVGKAMEPIDKDAMTIYFGDHLVAEGGARALGYNESTASAICAKDRLSIAIDLAVGTGMSRVVTCDLTHAYIDINGAYRT
ncbi:MAG: bifunctional glutamate N-acetyltransferase/amino-acid acetyltransferase ArgJ [Pseudomonadota bacterium]